MKNKIKYLLLICSAFFVGISSISAKTIEVLDCEYTDAYKKWVKMPLNERNKTTEPTKCKTNDTFFNNVGTRVNESYTSSRFDLRDYDYVTSVKNQENTGTCWTFATMASIESNLLINGKGNYDLSEAHLAFSSQKQSFDGLMPVNRTYDDGGNAFISSAYLFNRMGPILEKDMPFSKLLNIKNNGDVFPTRDELLSKKVSFSVGATSLLTSDQGTCTTDIISSIKKYLVNNGALFGYMYFDTGDKTLAINDNLELVSNTLNGAYYYYDGKTYISSEDKIIGENQTSNHGIAIVGWDDTISASKFSTKPTRDGAFIIKNSYGTIMESDYGNILLGENGYYYVSYDDINICTALVGFYNVIPEVNDNAYYYDTIGVNGAVSAFQDIYLGNIFNKKSDGVEKLRSVAFFSGAVGQKYDILFSNDGDLSNSSVIKSGTTDNIGYITIDVNSINISDSKFGIAIKFYDEPIIYTFSKQYFGLYNSMDVEKGLSFMSVDGANWYDFSVSYASQIAPIRAYTDNVSENDYYVFEKNETFTEKNNFTISYNFSNVNVDDITYNIFSASDTDYLNMLTYDFDIKNNLKTDKSLIISIGENTNAGDYVLVTKVKDTTIVQRFTVYQDNEELTFLEPKNGGKSDSDNNLDLIVNDNPKNNDDSSKTDNELTENSKTGDSFVLIIFCILIGCVLYYTYFSRSKNDNI